MLLCHSRIFQNGLGKMPTFATKNIMDSLGSCHPEPSVQDDKSQGRRNVQILHELFRIKMHKSGILACCKNSAFVIFLKY